MFKQPLHRCVIIDNMLRMLSIIVKASNRVALIENNNRKGVFENEYTGRYHIGVSRSRKDDLD